jgi:hypothetical protein
MKKGEMKKLSKNQYTKEKKKRMKKMYSLILSYILLVWSNNKFFGLNFVRGIKMKKKN